MTDVNLNSLECPPGSSSSRPGTPQEEFAPMECSQSSTPSFSTAPEFRFVPNNNYQLLYSPGAITPPCRRPNGGDNRTTRASVPSAMLCTFQSDMSTSASAKYRSEFLDKSMMFPLSTGLKPVRPLMSTATPHLAKPTIAKMKMKIPRASLASQPASPFDSRSNTPTNEGSSCFVSSHSSQRSSPTPAPVPAYTLSLPVPRCQLVRVKLPVSSLETSVSASLPYGPLEFSLASHNTSAVPVSESLVKNPQENPQEPSQKSLPTQQPHSEENVLHNTAIPGAYIHVSQLTEDESRQDPHGTSSQHPVLPHDHATPHAIQNEQLQTQLPPLPYHPTNRQLGLHPEYHQLPPPVNVHSGSYSGIQYPHGVPPLGFQPLQVAQPVLVSMPFQSCYTAPVTVPGSQQSFPQPMPAAPSFYVPASLPHQYQYQVPPTYHSIQGYSNVPPPPSVQPMQPMHHPWSRGGIHPPCPPDADVWSMATIAAKNLARKQKTTKRKVDDMMHGMVQNEGDSYGCMFCGRNFTRGNGLALHIKSHRDAAYRALAESLKEAAEGPPPPPVTRDAPAAKPKEPPKKRARTTRPPRTPAQQPSTVVQSESTEASISTSLSLMDTIHNLDETQIQIPPPNAVVVGPITPLTTPPRRSGESCAAERSLFWQYSPESHRRRTTTDGSSQWGAELFGSDDQNSIELLLGWQDSDRYQ